MRYFKAVNETIQVPEIVLGVMRMPGISQEDANALVKRALELGVNMFDTADIYAGGDSDIFLGKALKNIPREDYILQTKASIRSGRYDASSKHILESVDGSLQRLGLDYIDILLLHRPDALIEPEQVAEAFSKLHDEGKVKYFGVSNYNPYQIELLNHYLPDKLKPKFNQMQFSISHSNMVDVGINVNREVPAAIDYSAGTLQYSQLNDIRLQAWSPFQRSDLKGTFMNDPEYAELNKKLEEIADKYNTNPSAVAAAWILRHPAQIQVVPGTTKVKRLEETVEACKFELTHEEWYEIYRASGKIVP